MKDQKPLATRITPSTTAKVVADEISIITTPESPALPKIGDKNTAPTTTAAEDTVAAGQRHINRIWEYTQATLAIIVTGATLWVAGSLALREKGDSASFLLLSNAFFCIISTYLARTNHTRIGGVGINDKGR